MELTKEYLQAVRIELEKRGKSEKQVEAYINKLINGNDMSEENEEVVPSEQAETPEEQTEPVEPDSEGEVESE